MHYLHETYTKGHQLPQYVNRYLMYIIYGRFLGKIGIRVTSRIGTIDFRPNAWKVEQKEYKIIHLTYIIMFFLKMEPLQIDAHLIYTEGFKYV